MKVKFYVDKRIKIRWRIIGANGEIVGASTQGFATKGIARKNAKLVGEAIDEMILGPIKKIGG